MRDNKKLKYNIQLFATDNQDNPQTEPENKEAGDGNPEADAGTGDKEETSGKTLEELLADEKLQAEYQSRLQADIQKAISAKEEKEKYENMTPEEKAEVRIAELDKREAELNKRELQMQALEKLEANKIPKELAALLDYTGSEALENSIKTITDTFNAAVQAGVESKLTGGAPLKKAPAEKSGTVDEEQIRNAIRGIF